MPTDTVLPARGVSDVFVETGTETTEDVQPLTRPHLRYLDGLRGVAILMVLMIHSGQLVIGLATPVRNFAFYGVRGVQLFFIVSGLTLMLNYAGKRINLVNFAARRFFRIAPMFYAGALLYLLLCLVTRAALPTRSASGIDIAATFLFVHGWLPSAINTVVPGGWSIAAEAMFYVIFPVILILARRRRMMTLALLATYVIAGITNLALRRAIPGPTGQAFALYFWVVQLPAFVGGCWLAGQPQRAELRGVGQVALAIGIVALVIDSQLRGHSSLLVAVGLLTLVTWAAGVVRPPWLEGRILPFIGQISFSLYIVQFAVLAALHPFAPGIERAIGPLLAFAVIFTGALAISGALSYITYTWIERSIIRATRRVGLGNST